MNNIAIITARGGSKRIPNKNIKLFLGKPIIAYSIIAALDSGLFNEVMVSTDDHEIAKIAKEFGATVPFMRSAESADDYAILNDVLLEVKNEYFKRNKEFDCACIILPTAPFITVELMNESFRMLISNNFDVVSPVVKYSYPIQRALKIGKDGKTKMFFPEYYKSRSQDLEPAYFDAGQFYWINKDKTLIDSNRGSLIIPETMAQDIDTPKDWEMAELKYRLLNIER